MKAHRTKVSLALISAAFLFGCQEQASSPVGLEGPGPQFGAKKCVLEPDAKGCKDTKEGGQGGVPALLEMTGGMTTPTTTPSLPQLQPVDFQDGENTLVLNNPMPIEFAMALAATHSATRKACVEFVGKRANPSADDLDKLFNKLTDKLGNDGNGNRRFFVHIDKNALDDNSPNEHTISINWEDDNNEKFSVSVGKLSPTEQGTSTVTLSSGNLSSGVTVTFTGGYIRLRNRTGRVQEYFNLTCPIAIPVGKSDGDVITMHLSLPEAG